MSTPDFPGSEPPHDVLAAEEFAVPAPDPRLHHDAAHDVLAAEEFPLPAPDYVVRKQPVPLPTDPDDPSGAAPPHDVLAAEEFALPGTIPISPPPDYVPVPPAPGLRDYLPLVAIAVAVLGLILGARRRRSEA